MLTPSIVRVATPVATALTENGMVLEPRSASFPVGVVTDHLIPHAHEASCQPLTHDLSRKLSEYFATVNDNTSEMAGEEFDQLVSLASDSLRRMTTTCQQVIIPTCRQMVETYTATSDEARLPYIRVQPFVFAGIHSDPSLTHHVMEEYAHWRMRDEYRTFRLPMPEISELQAMVRSSKMVDDAVIDNWLAHTDAYVFQEAWHTLFEGGQAINPASLRWGVEHLQPFKIDQILAGYLFTTYLIKNPQDVRGESVTLNEWQDGIARLHGLLGYFLSKAYRFRARAREQGLVVFSYDVDDPVKDGRVVAHVNPDVYEDYIENGGSVQAILGAATTAQGCRTEKALREKGEDLEKAWERKHHFIREAKRERWIAQRRDLLRVQMQHGADAGDPDDDESPSLPALSERERVDRVNAALRRIQETDLDDPWRLITRLVCSVYYPNTPYLTFLMSMDRIKQENPEMEVREAATLATRDLLAKWLADQARTVAYNPVIKESAGEPEGETNEVTNGDTEASA